MPITVKGTFLMRTCSPTTGALPNSSRAVVAPRITTFTPDLSPTSVKLRPSATGQSRASRKSSLTPVTDVVQLASPTTSGAEPLTVPAAAATFDTLVRIAARSASHKDTAVPFAGPPPSRGKGSRHDHEHVG